MREGGGAWGWTQVGGLGRGLRSIAGNDDTAATASVSGATNQVFYWGGHKDGRPIGDGRRQIYGEC